MLNITARFYSEERKIKVKADSLVGEVIVHKVFGSGVVQEVHDTYLEVEFKEGKKHCKFLYPSCFDGYVRLENQTMQRRTQNDLRQWKKLSGALQEEELRKEYEKTQQEILERKNAAEEKKLKAARRAMEQRTVYQR